MNIKIICVGKSKERYWTEASAEYLKRLGAYCTCCLEEVKESISDDPQEKGESILKKIRKSDYVISLEIRGKELSSEEMADMIEKTGIMGISDICFIIGGSLGLSKKVTERADLRMSFSKMTFPHQMMRVILLEQIYRSFKIIRKERYHK
ncbi:MAG TPA: 23S rRNA (pseudouridine(1915)-N(3))-methyltransferase RlmH [Bacillota bacterium]|nr:23S rRNA (pseudouridine(1915)-N(3))-methyltransferase RlmH [Bacillota bacterium]